MKLRKKEAKKGKNRKKVRETGHLAKIERNCERKKERERENTESSTDRKTFMDYNK